MNPIVTSGITDRSRLVTNILLLVLLAGNIFFSIQYFSLTKQQAADEAAKSADSMTRLQTARFLKFYIDVVLNTQQTPISYEDRVKLENDVIQLRDPVISTAWKAFSDSTGNAKTAQETAVKLMALLTSKLI